MPKISLALAVLLCGLCYSIGARLAFPEIETSLENVHTTMDVLGFAYDIVTSCKIPSSRSFESEKPACGDNGICTPLNASVAKHLVKPEVYRNGQAYYICNCESGYTGSGCSKTCPAGLWGPDCAEKCDCTVPGSPSETACHPFVGICLCAPGWTNKKYPGDVPIHKCLYKCPEGTYGTQCQKACNCHNNGTCHHVTGECLCASDWTGPTCEERCHRGIPKAGCSFPCQCFPGRGTCNDTIGECVCAAGFMGPRCQWPCPTGFWGAGCANECNRKCMNGGNCSRENGKCVCPAGYVGEMCENAEEQQQEEPPSSATAEEQQEMTAEEEVKQDLLFMRREEEQEEQ